MGVDSLIEEEYERLWYVRRSSDCPEEGTEAWLDWKKLERRAESPDGSTRQRIAWHEAGHALVGHRLGRRVIKIATRDTYFDPPDPAVPYEVEHAIKVAGYVAEAMKFRRADPGRGEGARVSREFRKRRKKDTGKTVTPQECLVYMKETEDRARGILADHRGTLEALAQLVLKLGTVDQATLFGALDGVPNGDSPLS